MPAVTATAPVPGATRDQVWPVVADPERYRPFAEHVLSVEADGDRQRWAVLLNGSRVEWVQQEAAAAPERLEFHQLSGDLDQLLGSWSLHETAAGVQVELTLQFHLGIDGLAPLLDPIWAQSFQAHANALVRAVGQAVRPGAAP